MRPDTIPNAVTTFAAQVGETEPVVPVGGRTQFEVGGPPHPDAREVMAPVGVWSYEPSEMTVRCGAGTTIGELGEALAEANQMVPFDLPAAATVGGALSVGRSGIRRLRYGHIRDVVLQTRHIDATGQVVTAGGPTVKNVSGYDLCRLLVGSLGTLGVLAEVILRCVPVPARQQWLTAKDVDPFAVYSALYRPSAVLTNGTSTWVLLEGHPDDVEQEAASQAMAGFTPCEGQPVLPAGPRVSVRPRDLRKLCADGGRSATDHADWVAEVGVGVVHCAGEPLQEIGTHEGPAQATIDLMTALRQRLDPTGRLNPGRQPW